MRQLTQRGELAGCRQRAGHVPVLCPRFRVQRGATRALSPWRSRSGRPSSSGRVSRRPLSDGIGLRLGVSRTDGVTNRLLTSAQALAAIAALLRLDELGQEGDPAVRAQLDRIVDALGVRDYYTGLDESERSVVLSFARSYLAQALELIEDPARTGTWNYGDPVLLRAQGAASAVVARLIVEAAAGVGSRVTLLATPIQEFDDPDGFDLIWLPSFFIPEPVFDAAIERIFAVTRPGGMLVIGIKYGADRDPLAAAADDLFTVRSGGSIVDPEDGIVRLERGGFENPHEIERNWDAPLGLLVGRRA